MDRSGLVFKAAGLLLLLLAPVVPASAWTVTNLHPAGAYSSEAYGISGDQQVGVADMGTPRASLWTGTADSWVSLHPAGAYLSCAYGVSGGKQVGYADVPLGAGWISHACLWSRTAASWVDLHPLEAAVSEPSFAHGVWGSHQVGSAVLPADWGILRRQAGVWSGTRDGWVSLYSAESLGKVAYGIYGNQMVGSGTTATGGPVHAILWNGTKEYWVDLNPGGPLSGSSEAYAISGGQQVGWADVGGVRHASLWRGTAASWRSLHPAGASESHAWGISRSPAYPYWQVGSAVVGGVQRASLWSGTAESWVDLHKELPPKYSYSVARGVELSGWDRISETFDILIVGYAYNGELGRNEAMLWRGSVPKPLVSISNRAARHPIVDSGKLNYRFLVWGRVTVLDDNSFLLDDGSNAPVKVVAPGHGLQTNDLARATGSLNNYTDPPTLTSSADNVQKFLK